MLVNIVDSREHPYRWQSVDGAVEPAWHDNSCDQADQAEHHDTWSYDERFEVSVAEALAWANEKPGPTTLYLFDAGELQEDYEAARREPPGG